MLVTLSGMVTLVKPVQPENAEAPILVTLSGIVTLVKPVQPLKADAAIPFVPSLMTIAEQQKVIQFLVNHRLIHFYRHDVPPQYSSNVIISRHSPLYKRQAYKKNLRIVP